MQENMFLISIVVLFISFLLLGLGGFSFKLRAVTNKRAWDGWTKPLSISGAILFIIALILLYTFYPY